MSLQVNEMIDGKYRIVRLLGEGGMGAVYEGENVRIHRRIAIKVLHAGVAQSKDAVERFEREAQAAGRIGSEHIVEVLDLGNLPSGDRFMVMEYLEGEPLSARIASRGKLDPQTTARMALELLEGLKAAHEAGIVHRDLKPDNVFLLASRGGRKDFVKLLDFGISKFSTLGGDFSMTRTGAVMGTPYYMAPEQAKGERTVDFRADIYSTGVILYEAVAGDVPFNAETFNELLFKIVLETAAPLSERVPGVDVAFSNIVAKAMARNPADRYASAQEFQSALEAYLQGAVPLAKDRTAQGGTPLAALAATAPHVPRAPLDEAPVAARALPQGNTHGAWANTNSGALAPTEAPPKSTPPKWIWAAGGGTLVLAAAVAFALASSGPEGSPEPAAAGPEVPTAAPTAAAAAPGGPAAGPAAAAPVSGASVGASPSPEAAAPPPKPAEPTSVSPPGASGSAKDSGSAAGAAPSTAPKPSAPTVSAAKPPAPKSVTAPKSGAGSSKPAPSATKPATVGTSTPSSSSSGGRKIRTTL